MDKKNKKFNVWILIVSIVLVICIPFINGSRENFNVNEGKEDILIGIYGFPFDWLHLYTNNGFSFLGIGFIGNIIFFYCVIKILIWIYKKIFG
ncbi:hypothetical protein MKY34_00795 [Sporosarcina sp. FSL K6-1522]|uniref:hypothetical protein n=1 Tax=Sporosarcina sp. FSL K6-1522 TaxID=2921554 RepID=UPI00315A5AEF